MSDSSITRVSRFDNGDLTISVGTKGVMNTANSHRRNHSERFHDLFSRLGKIPSEPGPTCYPPLPRRNLPLESAVDSLGETHRWILSHSNGRKVVAGMKGIDPTQIERAVRSIDRHCSTMGYVGCSWLDLDCDTDGTHYVSFE